MKELNQLVGRYLKENGISFKFFASYIGCEYTKCSRWINGQSSLNSNQLKKVHEFLNGDFLRSVEDFM